MQVWRELNRHAGKFGGLIRQATDEVIATHRTRRWHLDECSRQEMAYLGVNIENLIRDALGLDAGSRMDFSVGGVDVDCKWTRNFGQWQIPREAVGHICLLVYGDDIEGNMAVGLVRIAEESLVGGNRDQKRTIAAAARNDILWIENPETPLPENFLLTLSKADRAAILEPRGGTDRMVQLFERCHGRVITRQTVESIGQQVDSGRRVRAAGARLLPDGYEVLCGYKKKDKEKMRALGFAGLMLNRSQYICLKSDGTTFEDFEGREAKRQVEAASFRKEYKKRVAAEKRERKRKRDELLKKLGPAVADVPNLEATDEYSPFGAGLVRDAETVAAKRV
ncbi:NaeI family type II restriction endonuclease [Actinoplanes sp. NPDC000266]